MVLFFFSTDAILPLSTTYISAIRNRFPSSLNLLILAFIAVQLLNVAYSFLSFCLSSLWSPTPFLIRSCVYLPRALSTLALSTYLVRYQPMWLFAALWVSFTCLSTPCVINPYFCEGRPLLSCTPKMCSSASGNTTFQPFLLHFLLLPAPILLSTPPFSDATHKMQVDGARGPDRSSLRIDGNYYL